MPWQCFMVRETGWSLYSLRRFRWGMYHEDGEACPTVPGKYSIHNASVDIGYGPTLRGEPDKDGYRWLASPPVEAWRPDSRWPTRCVCGYEFRPQDEWQVNLDPYYIADDGRQWPMKQLPIGAMLDAWWMKRMSKFIGSDGLSLQVKLPPGGPHEWWNIDGPSRGDGPGWTRTGTPPLISVTPSIATGSYHGFLGSSTAPGPGWLSDPL